MKLLFNHIICLLFLSLIFTSCEDVNDSVEPRSSFLKIYDDPRFEASYIPIDIKQTEEGGYLVLSARRIESSNFTGIQLLKVNAEGEVLRELEVSEQFIHPVNNLLEVDGNFYFVAMENISLRANLITVDPDSLTLTPTALGGLSYPLSAEVSQGEILLLSYDNNDKNTVVSQVSPAGTVGQSLSFTIGAGSDTEAPIIEHFTRTGKQLPFFVGRMGNLLFFNGFYNYTLSLVFTNLSGDVSGVVQGQQDDGGISAAMPLNGNNFAISRFNFGDNYLLPNQTVTTQGITSSVDMVGNPFPELVSDAPVIIKQVEIGSQTVTLYASNTKSGQVVLHAFSQGGELLGSRYIGFADPFEVAGFTPTQDGGLAVLGVVSVAGRFNRIFINKLSADQLAEIL